MNADAGKRTSIARTLVGLCAPLLLCTLYLGLLHLALEYLRDASRISIQQAALEVARPVIQAIVDHGAPPGAQRWGPSEVRPLTAGNAANEFERSALALATSKAGSVRTILQPGTPHSVVEFAVADGRGGVAATTISVTGGLAAVEARFQRLQMVATTGGLVVCSMFGVLALALFWPWRRAPSMNRGVGDRMVPAANPNASAELQRMIEEREHRLRQLTRHVPGMFYELRLAADGRWTIPFVSDRFAEMHGLPVEYVNDNGEALFERMVDADRTSVTEAFGHSARTLEPFNAAYRVQRDGEERWHATQAHPQRLGDGTIVWYGYSWGSAPDANPIQVQQAQGDDEANDRADDQDHELASDGEPAAVADSDLFTLLGDDQVSLQQLLRAFIASSTALVAEIERAVPAGDRASLRAAARKLAGVPREVYAGSLAELAAKLEHDALLASDADLRRQVFDLRVALFEAESFVVSHSKQAAA